MSLSYLPPSSSYTPKQALSSARQDVGELDDIMILGYKKDGSLYIRSSKLTRADALFMLEKAKLDVLDV